MFYSSPTLFSLLISTYRVYPSLYISQMVENFTVSLVSYFQQPITSNSNLIKVFLYFRQMPCLILVKGFSFPSLTIGCLKLLIQKYFFIYITIENIFGQTIKTNIRKGRRNRIRLSKIGFRDRSKRLVAKLRLRGKQGKAIRVKGGYRESLYQYRNQSKYRKITFIKRRGIDIRLLRYNKRKLIVLHS